MNSEMPSDVRMKLIFGFDPKSKEHANASEIADLAFKAGQESKKLADGSPDYHAILFELLDDLLLIQIGTNMFWASDEELAADHFASYVKARLELYAKESGWQSGGYEFGKLQHHD